MRKMIAALALALMSATAVMADNRKVSTALPENTPSVTLTLDGKTREVKPTKAEVKEMDEHHVRCTVFAGKDKASVTLPIGYDTLLTLGYRCADILHSMGLLQDKSMETLALELGYSNADSAKAQKAKCMKKVMIFVKQKLIAYGYGY